MLYVPVLRLKQSEWLALKGLSETEKDKMCPIIEPAIWFSDTKEKDKLSKSINKTTRKLFEGIGNRKVFFDPYIVERHFNIENFISNFFPAAENIGLSLVPVIRLTSSDEYFNVIRPFIKDGRIGLRIISDDIILSECADKIDIPSCSGRENNRRISRCMKTVLNCLILQ